MTNKPSEKCQRPSGRMIALFGTVILIIGCSKPDEVAHTTATQNAAMNQLDLIAKTPAKKPDEGRVSPPGR